MGAIDVALIVGITGVSSIAAAVTTAATLVREKVRRRRAQVDDNITQEVGHSVISGDVVTLRITDSNGHVFYFSPKEGKKFTRKENLLVEELIEELKPDQFEGPGNVEASGSGTVAIGGNIMGPVSTDVTDDSSVDVSDGEVEQRDDQA